jgi:rSAM/selenodomain-associated transferase 1
MNIDIPSRDVTGTGLTSVGLAIFVKTPGLSPVKTRLARGIGPSAAEDFHRHAAAAVADVARQARQTLPALTAYWAVAEAEAMTAPPWRDLPCLAQGDGDLGARMRHIYDRLRARHGAALLIGADAPQLQATDLQAACLALASHDAVIGPSADGGFWLFGGRVALPAAAWDATPWSQADTRERFVDALGAITVATLRTLRDVDDRDDLPALRDALAALPAPTATQCALADLLRGLPV